MNQAPGEAGMPWREMSVMDQRIELVALARQAGVNRRELFHRFGISAKTGYKWLGRADEDEDWASDRSRRPHRISGRSEAHVEAAVLRVRERHPAWGARKIVRCLDRAGLEAPAASTVHAILVRHGCIVAPVRSAAHCRFEHPAPNLVWQMDFKGRFALRTRHWCHALTVVDDHSRYALPDAFLVDNGSPWGDGPNQSWTKLGVWLLKLGVDVIHSRPYHPQTRGKNERFHRTLKAEVLALQHFDSFDDVQSAFDRWRRIYNHDRPHQALGQDVPASRYRPSRRSLPDKLPQPEYQPGDIVRTVGTTKGYVCFKGRLWPVSRAFYGERVALRPLGVDGCYGIFFGSRQIAGFDLRDTQSQIQ
jgi:transposase InsO family protein